MLRGTRDPPRRHLLGLCRDYYGGGSTGRNGNGGDGDMSVMRRVVMAALLFAAILTGSWAVAVTAWAFNGDKNKPPSLADRVATLEKRLAEVERQCGCQCAPKQASPTTQPAKKRMVWHPPRISRDEAENLTGYWEEVE